MRTEVQASECAYLKPDMRIDVTVLQREVEVKAGGLLITEGGAACEGDRDRACHQRP